MTDEPIRVYKPNALAGWVIDYGEGVEDHSHPELHEAVIAAEKVARAEGRELKVEEMPDE
jgi:hypothetical protein